MKCVSGIDIREWIDSRLPENKRQYNSPTTNDEIHDWFYSDPKYYDDPSFLRNSWNWFMMRAWSYIYMLKDITMSEDKRITIVQPTEKVFAFAAECEASMFRKVVVEKWGCVLRDYTAEERTHEWKCDTYRRWVFCVTGDSENLGIQTSEFI